MTSVSALATTTASTSTTNTTATNTTTTNTTTTNTTTTSTTAADQMGKDTFLKLLVAQLQYQDPSNPADATQFIAQTAQFTVVEKLADLATLDQQLLSASQAQSAASLVGRTVTWTDSTDAGHTGVVAAANLGSSPPTLTIDGQTVDLSAITSITAATATAPPTSTDPTGTTTPSSTATDPTA